MTAEALFTQLQLLPEYLGQHLLLTLVALVVGIAVCIPLGCLVTRVRSLQWPTLAVAGVLQTIPGIALLALMVPLLGVIGFLPALIALILYSFLPILRNTVTGILAVDGALKEAACGIGMTDLQMLFRVELPLAMPVIVAGIRTATVWVVGTATLATPVGATSLGNYIFSGLQTQNLTSVLVGCVAAAGLAVLLDMLIRLAEIATQRRSKRLGVVAAAALLLLFGGGLAPMVALSSGTGHAASVVIGSKPFTEQYVLAEMLSRRLSQAGFAVENRSGMGSIILFEALAEGAVDCYVDYTGTVWTNVMKRTDIPSRAVMLSEMTAWLKREYGILCVGALGFENTYALAVRAATARDYRLTSITDLAKVSGGLSMGSDYEFFSRPEWTALSERYGLTFRELRTLDPTLMYSAVQTEQVDVISAYSTDGRIAEFRLVVLTDPKQALPPYDAVLLLSPDAAENLRLRTELQSLVGAIGDSTMRESNRLVDVQGEPVEAAARYIEELLR